jgi:nitrogen-specific signal transduction histidine kinase
MNARLTERDLSRLVKKIIKEDDETKTLIARLRLVLDQSEKESKSLNQVCRAVQSVCDNFLSGKKTSGLDDFSNDNPFGI